MLNDQWILISLNDEWNCIFFVIQNFGIVMNIRELFKFVDLSSQQEAHTHNILCGSGLH